MKKLTYTITLVPLHGGRVVILVPAFPGCNFTVDFEDEAIAKAQETIELWLETMQEAGEPFPVEDYVPQELTFPVRVRRPRKDLSFQGSVTAAIEHRSRRPQDK